MTNNDLLSLSKRGLIPGPHESEEAFLNRAQESVSSTTPISLPLFGFCVDWIEVRYSNKKLPFWEGAALWTGEECYIQLREGFKTGRYLGYSREEVLTHEAVHAARVAFEEPKFEEVLAYRTSQNSLRKWVGPLFRRPWESAVLVCSLGAAVFGYFWMPLAILGCLGARLARAQFILTRCLRKIPLSGLVCLSDKEINQFSKLSSEEIKRALQQDTTFRGRFLRVRIFP
jgi:hypothetical protein